MLLWSAPVTQADDTLPATPNSLAFDAPPMPGATIGRYTILAKVGAGGMGVVYRALDPSLDREVALKLVRPARMRGKGGEEHRARLLQEARALAKLQHPNVIRVYDVGEHEGGVFFAMEFAQGKDASQWIALEAPVWTRILAVFRAAGRGLAAAHGAGLVHRDFKPANILVGDDLRVRVLDFGLARAAQDIRGSDPAPDDEFAEVQTADGIVVGTPAYMAPEQIQGLPADGRSDQFAFCVSLWECLFDELPYRGRTPRAMGQAKVLGKLAAPPEDCGVPHTLIDILAKGLSPNPGRRFDSMPDLLRKLRGVAEAAEAPDPGETTADTSTVPAEVPRDFRSAALPWIAFGLAASVALALYVRRDEPTGCDPPVELAPLVQRYRTAVDERRPEDAHATAAEIAALWRDHGCTVLAREWTDLAEP